MKSQQTKADHYRYQEAYREGYADGRAPNPCSLLPVKYYKNEDLADAWLDGFNKAVKDKSR